MFYVNEKEDTLRIFNSDYDESIREFSTSKFYTFMRRYSSPDNHDYKSFREFLSDYHCKIDYDSEESLNDIKAFFLKKKVLLLPVYAYIHSGMVYSTSPFSCPWDSGLAGVIFLTFEDIRNIFSVKKITQQILEKSTELLKEEIEQYNAYINGDIYGFEVLDKDGNLIDCGNGYIGEDIMKNGMYDDLPEWHDILKYISV